MPVTPKTPDQSYLAVSGFGVHQAEIRNVYQKDHHSFGAACNRNDCRSHYCFCQRTWRLIHPMWRRSFIPCQMYARQLVEARRRAEVTRAERVAVMDDLLELDEQVLSVANPDETRERAAAAEHQAVSSHTRHYCDWPQRFGFFY